MRMIGEDDGHAERFKSIETRSLVIGNIVNVSIWFVQRSSNDWKGN